MRLKGSQKILEGTEPILINNEYGCLVIITCAVSSRVVFVGFCHSEKTGHIFVHLDLSDNNLVWNKMYMDGGLTLDFVNFHSGAPPGSPFANHCPIFTYPSIAGQTGTDQIKVNET